MKIMNLFYSVVNVYSYKFCSGCIKLICKFYSFRVIFVELGLFNVFVMLLEIIDFFVCYGQCDMIGSVNLYLSFVLIYVWILEVVRSRFFNLLIQRKYLKLKCVLIVL